MAQIPCIRKITFNSRIPRSSRLASFAREAAEQGSEAYTTLTPKTCWVSAVEAARLAGTISKAAARHIIQATRREKWSSFVPLSAEPVLTQEQLLDVPAGSFLAFLGAPLGGEENPEDGLVLAHAMVYLGDGWAAGSNNMVIGGRPDWSLMDLSTLPWNTAPGEFSFTREGRNFRVRYRNIEDTQRPGCVIM